MLHPKKNNVLYCEQDVVFVFAKLQGGGTPEWLLLRLRRNSPSGAPRPACYRQHIRPCDIEALRQVCYNSSV